MANGKKAKVVDKAELEIKNKMEAIKKTIGDKAPTEAQVKTLKEFRATLGQMVFVRVANKRIPKVLKTIQGIGSLSGANYTSTDAQKKAIADAIKNAVEIALAKLQGKKESANGFQLPTT